MSAEFNNISFDMPKTQSNTIKVIGVGGGGSNAVNHMFQEQIKGVDFVICNTDAQALENSAIPNKIQLGVSLTSGLGAGAKPEVGEQAAKESIAEIQQMLNVQTKMVFITAGMGGGTGTGAAPIIAKIAKDMDILTVGIVTMPFQFEGKMRSNQAQIGIDNLRKNVDSLIVINNNKLREVYGNLGYKTGFSKADEVLSTAARGIAEVITHHYKQNIDLHDAKTVLSKSGTAIMGSAKESGEERAKNAIVTALDSPLLNDNKITGAKNVLLLIVSGSTEVTLDEIGEINDFIQAEAGFQANIIMGIGEDNDLGDAISITIVATGFAADQQSMITNTEAKKIIHTLEDEQKATYNFSEAKDEQNNLLEAPSFIEVEETAKVVHSLEDEVLGLEDEIVEEPVIFDLIPTTEIIENLTVEYDEIALETISEEDFVITNVLEEEVDTTAEDSLNTEEILLEKEVLFNLPLHSYEEVTPTEEIRFDLETTKAIYEMEVVDAEEIKAPSTPVVETRHVLENFDATPTIGKSSTTEFPKEEVDKELQLELKLSLPQKEINKIETESEEVSPLSLTISELETRAEERRQKMEGHNHRFTEQMNQKIEDIERNPAYKRMGVNLKESDVPISQEKTPLKTSDAKDDDLLNSKNSFLHDNVD